MLYDTPRIPLISHCTRAAISHSSKNVLLSYPSNLPATHAEKVFAKEDTLNLVQTSFEPMMTLC